MTVLTAPAESAAVAMTVVDVAMTVLAGATATVAMTATASAVGVAGVVGAVVAVVVLDGARRQRRARSVARLDEVRVRPDRAGPRRADAFGQRAAADVGPGSPGPGSGRRRRRGTVVVALGRGARRLARRRSPPDGETDPLVGAEREREVAARWGRTILTAVLLAPISVPAAAVGAAVMAHLPAWARRRGQARDELREIHELPEIVDLLAVAVASGSNTRLALDAVVASGRGVVHDELATCLDRCASGTRLADALEPLRHREHLRPLAEVLIDGERHGSPLLAPLAALTVEARARRRRAAEEAARRLPVTLLFPLVLCVLPAFGLLTVVPLLAGSLQSLHL